MDNNSITCTVTAIKSLTANTSEISLTPKQAVDFFAGQYITVYLEHKKLPYSIASSPHQKIIQLLVFHGANNENIGFFENNLGKTIQISEPMGKAFYRPNNKVIIAIGKNLGISPIKSIIDYLTYIKTHLPSDDKVLLYLYYLGYKQEEFILDSYFRNLVNELHNDSLDIDILYKPVIIEDKNNLAEIHNNLLLINNNKLFSIADFYVYGSNDFVSNIYFRLLPDCHKNFFTDALLDPKYIKIY